MSHSRGIPPFIVAATFLGSACNGQLSAPLPSTLYQLETSCDANTPLVVPMRRLTFAEYKNTIRHLFGDTVQPSDAFPLPASGRDFSQYADANLVNLSGARSIMDAAEEVAVQAVAHLDVLTACGTDESPRACAERFITSFGTKAFRRPIRDDERAELLALFDGVGAIDFQERMALVLTAMLQMPAFLYVIEAGVSRTGDVLQLSDYEIAARLSYLLWDDMPDDELLAAAAVGRLHADDDLAVQVERMVADPRFATVFRGFLEEWWQVDLLNRRGKDATLFPTYAALLPSMRQEFGRFFDHLRVTGGSINDLLTSSTTFVNQPLEAFYGLPPESAGIDDWHAVTLPAGERPGALTRPAVLAAQAWPQDPSPVFRGKLVRMQLLCEELPPPPPAAMDVKPTGDTVRERAEFLINDSYCGACHSRMDPIGLGLMTFDAIGQHTSTAPIDSTSTIVGDSDVAGTYQSVAELTSALAASAQVRACVVRQTLQFMVARAATSARDACVADAVAAGLGESQPSLVELLTGPTHFTSFGQRRVAGGEL